MEEKLNSNVFDSEENSNVENNVEVQSKIETESEVEDKVKEENEVIFCSKCGTKNNYHDKFCINCGHGIRTIEDTIKDTTSNIKEAIVNNETYKNLTSTSYEDAYKADWDNKDMINFIQKKTEYYIPKFKEIQELQKSTSWNWAAFFFNVYWFLYRKMYAYGFGILAISFIISFIPVIGGIAALGISILVGLYGNILYLKHTQKQLELYRNMNEDVRQRTLLSKGGVNIAIPIIVMVVIIVIALILGFLGAFMFMLSSPSYY